jgi:hypothetical protein
MQDMQLLAVVYPKLQNQTLKSTGGGGHQDVSFLSPQPSLRFSTFVDYHISTIEKQRPSKSILMDAIISIETKDTCVTESGPEL